MQNTGLNLSGNIKKLRESYNMTQANLAEKMNLSDKTISKWENGNAEPSLRYLCDLARIFNVPISQLTDGYISEDFGSNKDMERVMEQILHFMSDINKKINSLMQENDVISDYLKAVDIENKEEYRVAADNAYEPSLEEIYKAKIGEEVCAGRYDEAFSVCDEAIFMGCGEMAWHALQIDKQTKGFFLQQKERCDYAKVLIHHLMKQYGISKDDFLE